ncbi:hypothetical protein BYT27DRAFT_7181375 [Phlegmacium glaucopus]|nr:hypothetical protein BYT27DRAFT_7181375 [Phlegmacium glaucopus]
MPKVTVKTTQEEFQVDIDPSQSLAELKAEINMLKGYATKNQKLIPSLLTYFISRKAAHGHSDTWNPRLAGAGLSHPTNIQGEATGTIPNRYSCRILISNTFFSSIVINQSTSLPLLNVITYL